MSAIFQRRGLVMVPAIERPADEPDSIIDRLDAIDPRKKPVVHGTLAGLLKHKRHGEDPCDECIEGGRLERRTYQRKWRNSPMKLQPCGTWAAHQRHRYHGEEPCEPCMEAARAYSRSRYVPRKPMGVICEVCRCLCKRGEDCPMCRWNAIQTERKAA